MTGWGGSPVWLTLAVGAAVGVAVGIVGTSGAIMIPVMVLVFGLSQLKAQGTALFIACMPIWIAPVVPYWRAGNVNWRLGVMLAAGVAAGGYFGAGFAQQLPQGLVRKLFAMMLAVVALRMFIAK